MSSNFERLHEIINEAYAENFSCLSHWEVRNPHPLSNSGSCWTSLFEFVAGCGKQLSNITNISGIADVIYVLLTANYIGRRYALSISHLIIGVSCLSMAFIPKEYSNTILALYLVSTVFAGASKYHTAHW